MLRYFLKTQRGRHFLGIPVSWYTAILTSLEVIRMFACFSPGEWKRVKEKLETPGTPFIAGKLCICKFLLNPSKSSRNVVLFGCVECNWFPRMPFLVVPPCKNLWYFFFITLTDVGFSYCFGLYCFICITSSSLITICCYIEHKFPLYSCLQLRMLDVLSLPRWFDTQSIRKRYITWSWES